MKTTTSKAMSLKGNIKNLAKEKKVPPQIILQNFMFERFLQRLSLSEYRNNFIIKGGVLISCLVGLESRSTMDIDTTIKNYPLTEKDLKNIFEEIIGIQLNDNTVFLIDVILFPLLPKMIFLFMFSFYSKGYFLVNLEKSLFPLSFTK